MFLQRTVAAAGTDVTEGPEPLQASATHSLTPKAIEKQISARNAARTAKNFAEADRIRAELLKANVVLEDGPAGTTWRRS